MFDALPSTPRDTALEVVRDFFGEHGHALAEAAGFIGGSSAGARVFDLGARLTRATRMTDGIRRDLVTLHRLLSLEELPDHVDDEILVLSGIDLGSPQIMDICLLADLLGGLIETIPAPPMLLPPARRPAAIRCLGPRAA